MTHPHISAIVIFKMKVASMCSVVLFSTPTICQCKCDTQLNIDGVLQILDLHFLRGTPAVNAKQTNCSFSESCFHPGFKDFAPLLHGFKEFFFFFLLFFSSRMKVIICFWVTSQLRRFVGLLGHPRNVKWGVAMVSSSASQHSEEARLMMSKDCLRTKQLH